MSLLLQKTAKYHKIAAYSKQDWQDEFATMLQWFTTTPFKFFHNRQQALDWRNTQCFLGI